MLHRTMDPGDPAGGTKTGRLAKQALINLSYLALAICMCVRGPSLLDLADVYSVEVGDISFNYLAAATGSMIGSMMVGVIMEKFSTYKYSIMCTIMLMLSCLNSLLPFGGTLWGFYAIAFSAGLSIGALHTGCNVITLIMWRGVKGSKSHMHFLHFCSSAGAFIGPLLAKNFLDHADVSNLDAANATASLNLTHTELDDGSGTSIATLFPLTGLIVLIVNVGFAFLAVREIVGQRQQNSRTITQEKTMNEEQSAKLNVSTKSDVHEQQDKRQRLRIWTVYALVFIYMFFYVAVEFNVASFLPTFAVKCQLRLSKAEGANLMAIFMGAYAITRLLFTFAAAKLKPNQIFAINLSCCLIGNIGVIVLGEHYLLALQLFYGLLGFGMASMFANTWVWLEQYVTVSSKLAGLMTVCGGLGIIVFCTLMGLIIDDMPMMLVYIQLAVTGISILIFAAATVLGRQIKQHEIRRAEQGKDLKEEVLENVFS